MTKKSAPVKAKPIRVERRSKDGHCETRVFAREIQETYCVKKGCRFYGKPAAQGVCHSTETMSGISDWTYIKKALEYSRQIVAGMKKSAPSQKEYVRQLEGAAEHYWMNHASMLDELIYLRAQLAVAEDKLSKKSSARSRSRS